jgi:hypothetical protein
MSQHGGRDKVRWGDRPITPRIESKPGRVEIWGMVPVVKVIRSLIVVQSYAHLWLFIMNMPHSISPRFLVMVLPT